MKLLLACALLGWLAACSGHVSARTESTVINGRGAANTGVLDGRHMPES
jgi:hypothetical protein